jgi:hypothetical protein
MLAEFLTEIPMSRALPRIAVQGTKRNFSKSFGCAAEAIQMRKDRFLTPAVLGLERSKAAASGGAMV